MRNTVIHNFMYAHKSLLSGLPIVRGLYLRMGTNETFVLECREWRNKRSTFVFEFDCGSFYSCKTELNIMEKYLENLPNAEYAEYVTL